jgi:hypothetical protein
MRFGRLLLSLIALTLMGLGFLSIRDRLGGWLGWGKAETTTTHGILLTQITQLGRLELVRYNFKDIVEHEQAQLLLPNAKAVLIVEGEATGCIDLTKITPADIVATADSLTIRLPQPELCVWKINHERSRIYDTQWAFLDQSALVSEAYRQAERQIRQSALSGGLLAQTRQSAVQLLRPLLAQVSGKRVGFLFAATPAIGK